MSLKERRKKKELMTRHLIQQERISRLRIYLMRANFFHLSLWAILGFKAETRVYHRNVSLFRYEIFQLLKQDINRDRNITKQILTLGKFEEMFLFFWNYKTKPSLCPNQLVWFGLVWFGNLKRIRTFPFISSNSPSFNLYLISKKFRDR